MRKAENVLEVIQKRGNQGKPLEDIYRQLFNPALYLRAYGRLSANDGAMTPGITAETIDDMSLDKIKKLIEKVRFERYQWTPVRRVYIPKKNGKLRPLGLPTWSDKLLQEVMRQILEAYYEPQFNTHSHGFRPKRGCHTALSEVTRNWTGTHWFIEGDISKCFDRLDHTVLMAILKEKLHDNRFIRLISNLLETGYMEDWRWNATLSGSPQGGVISPILSNIYLEKLDQYVETVLLPKYNYGEERRDNPEYSAITRLISQARQCGDKTLIHQLKLHKRQLPSHDPNDPNYRRLRYVRYCDDFLLGFIGPKSEAEEIKDQIRNFLWEQLKLELSEEKTLVTHSQTQAARFLGYELFCQQSNDRLDRNGRRCVNGNIALRVPNDVIKNKCALYMQKGRPERRPEMIADSDYSILSQYQSEYRGVVQYYSLAQDVFRLGKLHWVMETSLLKTLANKHKTSVAKMAAKYKSMTDTPYGIRKCLQVVVERDGNRTPLVAKFGGIPLRRQKTAVLVDQAPPHFITERNELLQRMLADKCEICGKTGECSVHHIHKLADLEKKGRAEKPAWVKHMIARRRKTLVVCRGCHTDIHNGKLSRQPNLKFVTGEPDDAKVSSPVRRGADGKVL